MYSPPKRGLQQHHTVDQSCCVPPGDVSAEQMLVVATWAEQFGIGEIRITHEQNFVTATYPPERLTRLWQQAQEADLATATLA